jgi:hypothetical protein
MIEGSAQYDIKVAHKKVGFLLGASIVILPFVLSWFTLRHGYGRVSRIIFLGWMGLVLAVVALGAAGGGSETAAQQTSSPKPSAATASIASAENASAGYKSDQQSEKSNISGLSESEKLYFLNLDKCAYVTNTFFKYAESVGPSMEMTYNSMLHENTIFIVSMRNFIGNHGRLS